MNIEWESYFLGAEHQVQALIDALIDQEFESWTLDELVKLREHVTTRKLAFQEDSK